MIALFPCKANPPHIGHIVTLLRIKDDYDKIIIDLLDTDLLISAEESISILRKVLDHFSGKFEYWTHEDSYATLNEFDNLPEFDVVVTGNKKIYENMKKNGFEVKFIERTPSFYGEFIREAYLKGKEYEQKGKQN